MKCKYYMLGFLFLSLVCRGQETDYIHLLNGEKELKGLFSELYHEDGENREMVLKRIQTIMPHILSLPGAMDYPWSLLDNIGVKSSEDNVIRIFTWHLMDDPDSYRYFGYIQVAQKRNRFEVFPLIDNGKDQRGVYRLDQKTDDWYGKLYYEIVTRKVKRRTYYTLLGMDFNNSRSNLKMVEMLTIQRNRPQFEKKRFTNGKEVLDRVVLEYSDQVSISVRYNSSLEMIVYDHLVPLHQVYENNYEFYGPDGSFDGLKFIDESWSYQEDIDARMPY